MATNEGQASPTEGTSWLEELLKDHEEFEWRIIPRKGFYHVTKPGCKKCIMKQKRLRPCNRELLHEQYDKKLCEKDAPAGVFLSTTLWMRGLPTITPYPRNEPGKEYPSDTEYDRVTIKAEDLGITPSARMFCIGEVEENGVTQVHLMLIRCTTDHEMKADEIKAVEFATKYKLEVCNLNGNPWLQISIDPVGMKVNNYTKEDKTFVNVFVVGEVTGTMLGDENNWDQVKKM